jgi:hypothetical protein
MTITPISDEALAAIKQGLEGVQGGPWKLDKFACYVWAPSEKGGDFPLMDELGENGRVAELRGWGYYTGKGHGALGLDPDDARNRQRLTGEHVARLDPRTVASLIARVEAAESALAVERRTSRGDWASQREVDAMAVDFYPLDRAVTEWRQARKAVLQEPTPDVRTSETFRAALGRLADAEDVLYRPKE